MAATPGHPRGEGDPAAVHFTLTSDTYASLLPELDREIAEKAANLVQRARKATPEVPATSAHAPRTQEPENGAASEPIEVDPDAA
jgi:hypothetical protein